MAVILFRIFDIWKPYPLRHLERLPGGWGIMLDDLGAGIYAWIWLQIGIWLIRFIA
jgi:phosphatidylglycerophosphatase A